LLADVAIVTMAEQDSAAAEAEAAIRGTVPDLDVVNVVFRPDPLTSVSGRRVFHCCTAPVEAGPVMREHLERVHGCEVVGMSHRLADRASLVRDLEAAPPHDVLLTELKAASVDVAVRHALGSGREVVFVNNTVVGTGIEDAFDRALELSLERARPGRQRPSTNG
jgi:cyclic 2,3-diphosphoglycerate synthetase